ncbi:MAG: hypothetical protein R3C56_37085 [Pirellulaceae bacterium]
MIITGNAGDGKAAFLQKLEQYAKDEGAVIKPALRNGRDSMSLVACFRATMTVVRMKAVLQTKMYFQSF